jgi:transposase-like protein
MAKSVLSADWFHNEEAAFAYVEAELWPNGPVCPHCGNADGAKIGRLTGKTTRAGLRKCYAAGCRKPFTVRMGTVFEDSHLPLRLWLQAIHLLCSSKKGISTRQLQRTLGCGMKTAWHLSHRIREMMTPANPGKLGGSGMTVEADETELARSRKSKKIEGHRRRDNVVVVNLVERSGRTRSMMLDHRGVMAAVRCNVHENSRLVTDKAPHYKFPPVASHESVDHSKFKWARGDVHTNTLEGFFSALKRGLVGEYQHVDQKHLGRYLSELDFRQNTCERLGVNDEARAAIVVQGAAGKRLTYQTTGQ